MKSNAGILIVDRNERNVQLLSAFLNEAGYTTHGVSDVSTLDDFLERLTPGSGVALALVDLTGFPTDLWERCRRIHDAGIVLIVIARAQLATAQTRLQREGRRAGAARVLTKPLRKEQLLTLVRILTGTDG